MAPSASGYSGGRTESEPEALNQWQVWSRHFVHSESISEDHFFASFWAVWTDIL